MEKKSTPMCDRCKVNLEMADVNFSYLEHSFRHRVPRCPECGQVYLSEELVERVKEVEANFEDK
jgi:uncharacterized protein with PIN domain